MDSDWSSIELDRKLGRAFSQWRGWRARWREAADPDDDPLAIFRAITGQTLFRELAELPDHDPLRGPLRRWVYRLSEQRINHDLLTQMGQEWQRKEQYPDTPRNAEQSLSELFEQGLTDTPRRERWLRAFLAHASPASALAVALWQRRREIAHRLGVEADADAPGRAVDEAVLIAGELRKVTYERVRELELDSLPAFVTHALGQDVAANWPAHLSPDRLLGYFRDSDLLRSLDLAPARLPVSLGAASFSRALGRLGAAWFEALAPRDQPFVVAHDPYGLKRREASSLFALLPLSPRFLTSKLEVSKLALADVQRRLAQLWLLDLAGAAFRVRLRPYALSSERGFREHFSELAHADLDLSLPPDIAGTFLRLGVEDEQRLVGQLLAVQRARDLVEAHDEDWFRNPRAVEQLRAEAHQPPEIVADKDKVRAALRLTLRELERLLR